MPTTDTINTQQLIQMGAHTEKLQQTLQHLPLTTSQQLQDEQVSKNDLKQIEIQDPDDLESTTPADSDGKRRREARLRRKELQDKDMEKPIIDSSKDNSSNIESQQGQQINIIV